jgi:predicted nucleic acid-binding protein
LTGPNRAFVPALWRVEVPNGFAVAEKRGMITASDAMMAVQKFEMLLTQSIETVLEPVSLSRVLASARRFRLSPYDACYLDLAQDMHLPLATLDRQLAEAAKQAGVPLLN